MNFTVKSEHPASVKTGCVILGVFERRKLSEPASRFDKTTRGLLGKLLADGEMDGKCGDTLLVHLPTVKWMASVATPCWFITRVVQSASGCCW